MRVRWMDGVGKRRRDDLLLVPSHSWLNERWLSKDIERKFQVAEEVPQELARRDEFLLLVRAYALQTACHVR
jgi:hypothetical protein